MNDKNELGLGSDPAVKESLTAASKQHAAMVELVVCRTARTHTNARIMMEGGPYPGSTMQKMHFAHGTKSAATIRY